MTDNRTTELVSRREATTLLEEFLCGYQNILLSRGINASEAVCKQNELIDEYAERIDQAIAATLGSGTLTAEQVMAIAGRHQPNYCSDTHVCFDWQAIADELNAALGSDECEFMPFKDEDCGEPNAVRGVCSKCSALMYGKDNYCPNCGAKVV